MLLTNDCLSGSSAADFPIPARNVLSSPWEVDDALGRVFGDWMRESAEYEPMRVQYDTRVCVTHLYALSDVCFACMQVRSEVLGGQPQARGGGLPSGPSAARSERDDRQAVLPPLTT